MNEHELKHFFERAREQAQQAEKAIRETKPYYRPSKTYAYEVFKFNLLKANQECNLEKVGSDKKRLNCTQILTKRHSSNSIDYQKDLVPITLSQMKVNMIHHGKYLLCRTVVDPLYASSMVFLVSDRDDQVETVCIYNYFATLGYLDQKPNLLIPCGTHLVIKEPFLKIMADGNWNIRIDSPTDILILSKGDNLNNNMSSDKIELFIRKGNQYFAQSFNHLAIQVYSQAIENFDKDQIQNVSCIVSNTHSEKFLKNSKFTLRLKIGNLIFEIFN